MRVSIVIPCHNQGKYLRCAAESALLQSGPVHEIIIVDDFSTDDTRRVAEEIIAENPFRQIVLIVSDEQSGLSASRNAAINHARGDVILPLDADDWLHPLYVERAAAAMRNAKADVVHTDYIRFGLSAGAVRMGPVNPSLLPLSNRLGYCSLFTKDLWKTVGGYPANFPDMGYEDWEFWIAAKDANFSYVPEYLWFYRVRGGTMAQHALDNHDFLMSRIITRHPDLYADETVMWATGVMEGRE